MIQTINYTALKNNGFTNEQIDYLKECSNQKDWEDIELQKRWLTVIGDMSNIIYDWDKEQYN